MTPFFCLAVGWVAQHATLELRFRKIITLALVVLVAINAGWRQWPLFAQHFPDGFTKRAAKLLAEVAPAEPGKTYYRFVNVDNYVLEPDRLIVEPEATLLAQAHPYQFIPNLYEGQSKEQRAARRSIDHRMRLVRVRVPAAATVTGAKDGEIQLTVRFVSGRAGMAEPLLSLGARNDGELLFVRYTADRELKLGLESQGREIFLSHSIAFEPGRDYQIKIFTGSLLTPEVSAALSVSKRLFYQNLAVVFFGEDRVIEKMIPPHHIKSNEIYAGYNFVEATSAIPSFSGEVVAVVRGGYPVAPAEVEVGAEVGPMRFLIKLPGPTAGAPEPLIVIGEPGDANLCYVRVLPGNQIKVGAEFWGYGAFDSEAIAVDPSQPLEIVFALPVFFSATEQGGGQGRSREEMNDLRSHLRITVAGKKVLEREIKAPLPKSKAIFYGKNPVGGSWVNPVFTGEILQVSRQPVWSP